MEEASPTCRELSTSQAHLSPPVTSAHFTDGNTEARRDEPTCSRRYSYNAVGHAVNSDGPTLSFMSCSLSVFHDGH